MKLLFVIGTRPEAIKQAPVIVEARRRAAAGAAVQVRIVSTGQHREMLRPILRLFDIQADIDLDLMEPGQSLESLTAKALRALAEVLRTETPDRTIVQGDTTTAMAGALASFYANVPVVHLEAGLRTNNLRAPFPEEANRRIIGQLAALHLAPTAGARDNILREHLTATGARVVVTGNTVIDALFAARERLRATPASSAEVAAARAWRAANSANRVVLVTGHRRENFGEAFESFCLGLRDIAQAHPQALLIYPVHLNPRVQEPVHRLLGGIGNLRLAPVADYPEFVALLDLCDFAITDSGGVQEEAPALGKPVLVTRDVTERPEAVEAGGVLLVGPHRERIREEAARLLIDAAAYERMARARSPYGDGHAAARCVAAILGEPFDEFA